MRNSRNLRGGSTASGERPNGARSFWIGLIAATLCAVAAHAQTAPSCDPTSESCQGEQSRLFAMAHAYGAEADRVLYRLSIPSWRPADFVADAAWSGTHNGFFYQVETLVNGATTSTQVYTPFNGIHIDNDRLPVLPAFHMYPAVASESTSVVVTACSSNYSGSASSPVCRQVYWSDRYDAPPQPALIPVPPITAFDTTFTMDSADATPSVPDSGVAAISALLRVNPGLTAEQRQFVLDHTLFFRDDGTAYDNDIHGQGIGILEFDEAVYVDASDGLHQVRYGTSGPIEQPPDPDRRLFFYATGLNSQTQVQIAMIYDQSESCTGYISTAGSNNTSCSSRHVGNVVGTVTVTVGARAWKPTPSPQASAAAGQERNRAITLGLFSQSGDLDSTCADVLNPLAVYPSESVPGFRPPNYLIDDSDWSNTFPIGLYYAIDAGFGTCIPDGGSDTAPFCDQTPNYVGYVPHYFDVNGSFGELNGGSTSQSVVTGIQVADQYALGNINALDNNTLVFFDSCGYGHTYRESGNAGLRKTLPAAPDDFSVHNFSLQNDFADRPVVYAKGCCASWYQFDENEGPQSIGPPHTLDDGFGMFIPSGRATGYQTLFGREFTLAYDGVSGTQLFKLYHDTTETALYACSEEGLGVLVTPSASEVAFGLGSSDPDALACTTPGVCPFGTIEDQSGSEVTCGVASSTFVGGFDDWADGIFSDALQLRLWGAAGHNSNYLGGNGGFSLTVLDPKNEQTRPEAFYVYVGHAGSDDRGGVGSLVTTAPLSLFGSDQALQTTSPATMDVLLIAGGGGSDGAKTPGTFGGNAIANAPSNGVAVSEPGLSGLSNTGLPGNLDLLGGKGGHEATAGVGGLTGDGEWITDGTLIPPNTEPLSWDAGFGDHGNGAGGGGGFGGGTHPSSDGPGGGGGGSWAAANGAYDATAPTADEPLYGGTCDPDDFDNLGRCAPVSPAPRNENDGYFQLAYVSAPCSVVATRTGNAVRCTYTETVQPLDFEGLVDALFGPAADERMPVVLEAWSGGGGHGLRLYDGLRRGGQRGYARTARSLSEVFSVTTDGDLYLYPGARGNNATPSSGGLGGGGGASTLVSGVPLSALGDENLLADPAPSGVLLVAGGGGGGGAQITPESIGGIGGRGGIAIAGMDGDRSCGGGNGSPARDENNPTDPDAVGGGGNGGAGRCDGSRTGSGGIAGSSGGADGVSGVGGHGGRKTGNSNGATWIDSGITAWTAGNGGDPAGSNAGAGGGGFGGGGAGGTSSRGFIANGAGGGGGGSWARKATYDDLNAPVRGIAQSPSGSGKGAVTVTFDVCAFAPDSRYCSGVGIARIQPEMSLVATPSDRQLRLRIHGSETFDVGAIDTSRFAFGFAAVEPTRIQRKDLDADGFDDLELRFRVDHLPPTRPGGEHDALEQDGVHCLFGASVSGESFHACVRAELPGVRGTVRSNRTRGESRALRSPSAR